MEKRNAFELAGEARLMAYQAEAEFARQVFAAIVRQYRRLVSTRGSEDPGQARPAQRA